MSGGENVLVTLSEVWCDPTCLPSTTFQPTTTYIMSKSTGETMVRLHHLTLPSRSEQSGMEKQSWQRTWGSRLPHSQVHWSFDMALLYFRTWAHWWMCWQRSWIHDGWWLVNFDDREEVGGIMVVGEKKHCLFGWCWNVEVQHKTNIIMWICWVWINFTKFVWCSWCWMLDDSSLSLPCSATELFNTLVHPHAGPMSNGLCCFMLYSLTLAYFPLLVHHGTRDCCYYLSWYQVSLCQMG